MYVVQDILCKYLDHFVIIFIDDILLFYCTTEEHAEHLRLIFQRLKEHHVHANASKCLSHVVELEFLVGGLQQRVLILCKLN